MASNSFNGLEDIHGPEVLRPDVLPIGQLSEEARNADTGKHREVQFV